MGKKFYEANQILFGTADTVCNESSYFIKFLAASEVEYGRNSSDAVTYRSGEGNPYVHPGVGFVCLVKGYFLGIYYKSLSCVYFVNTVFVLKNTLASCTIVDYAMMTYGRSVTMKTFTL